VARGALSRRSAEDPPAPLGRKGAGKPSRAALSLKGSFSPRHIPHPRWVRYGSCYCRVPPSDGAGRRMSGHMGPAERSMTTGRTSYIPPAPREATHASDTWVSLCVAIALGLAAVTIALWPGPRRAEAATQTEALSTKDKDRLSNPASETAPPPDSPTRFTNPFDASETFEFPPGTTVDDARNSVAEILFERARERGVQMRSIKRVHARPSTSVRIPRLVSKDVFKNAS
jgi:hypothetical protein